MGLAIAKQTLAFLARMLKGPGENGRKHQKEFMHESEQACGPPAESMDDRMRPVGGVGISDRIELIVHPRKSFHRPLERRTTRSRLELLPPELIRRIALCLHNPRDVASLVQVRLCGGIWNSCGFFPSP